MLGASQVSLVVKNPPPSAGDLRDVGSIPGSGSPLEEEVATQSNFLAWRIPRTEEPGGLWSIRLKRVKRDWSDLLQAWVSVAVWASRGSVFSYGRAQALGRPGPSSCSTRAQKLWLRGPKAQAEQLQCKALGAPWHTGSSQTRDQTHVSWAGRQILYHWTTREAQEMELLKQSSPALLDGNWLIAQPTLHPLQHQACDHEPQIKAGTFPLCFCLGRRGSLGKTQPPAEAQLKTEPQCYPILPSESYMLPTPSPVSPSAITRSSAWGQELSPLPIHGGNNNDKRAT